MGAEICGGQPSKVITLKKVKIDDLEYETQNFHMNNDKENVIENFEYEEYAFAKEEEDAHENQHQGNDDNAYKQNQTDEKQSLKNEEIENVFVHQYDSSEVRSKGDKTKCNNNNDNNNNANSNHAEDNGLEQQESKDNNLMDQHENYSKANFNSSYQPEQDQEQEPDQDQDQSPNDGPNKHLQMTKTAFLPKITSFIPEKILKSKEKSELLFVSDLKKMINVNSKERLKYSDRFCMMTKENFILYNTKENYITLKRPLGVIPLDLITRVVLFKLNKAKRAYDHFYICFIKTEATAQLLNQINTFFMNTMNQTQEIPNDTNKIEENNEEALLMFTSENIDFVKKWYVVINHLIKERDNACLKEENDAKTQ